MAEDDPFKDVLYVATTRPAMKMGVPVEGLFINATITYLAYLWIGHGHLLRMLLCLLIFPIVHVPMRILTAIDHNLFRSHEPLVDARPLEGAAQEHGALVALVARLGRITGRPRLMEWRAVFEFLDRLLTSQVNPAAYRR
jgi:type IV secretion system protein VirB3